VCSFEHALCCKTARQACAAAGLMQAGESGSLAGTTMRFIPFKEWESSTSGPAAPCSRAAAVREVKAAARAELAARDGRARELAAERNAALALAQQHAQQVQARVGCLTAAQQQLSMRSAGNYARVCLSVLAWCPRRWGRGKTVCATLPTPAVAGLTSSTQDCLALCLQGSAITEICCPSAGDGGGARVGGRRARRARSAAARGDRRARRRAAPRARADRCAGRVGRGGRARAVRCARCHMRRLCSSLGRSQLTSDVSVPDLQRSL